MNQRNLYAVNILPGSIMAKFKEREIALQLRDREKLSYSQIKERLKVSKSTLSYWLRNYPLSNERINELRAWSEKRIERFRGTMQRKREARAATIYVQQKKELLPLTKKEMFIAGLFLYAGEGAKSRGTEVALSNTNPLIIQFFVYWITRICGVPKKRLKVKLHLYRDMDIVRERCFWMKLLGLGEKQFKKPYIKASSKDRISYRGGFGHGTCNIIVSNVPLFEKIMMSIKVVLDSTTGA